MAEVRAYIDMVWNSEWMEETYPHALRNQPRVESRSSSARYSVYDVNARVIVIANSPWHRTTSVALHEFAHFLEPDDGHGALWRTAYLRLVREFMGFDAYGMLVDGYRREFG